MVERKGNKLQVTINNSTYYRVFEDENKLYNEWDFLLDLMIGELESYLKRFYKISKTY